MAEAAAMALVLVSLLSTATSSRSSLLPSPVEWGLVVLVTLVLVASLVELGRRKSRGS